MFKFKNKKVQKREKTTKEKLVESLITVVVALGLAFIIQAVLVKPYKIPSGSMLPTLKIGERVLVNRVSMNFTDPHVGQIVVFNPPQYAETENFRCGVTTKNGLQPYENGQPCSKPIKEKGEINFIKRLVAGPGDTVSMARGRIIRNGKKVDEPYAAPCIDIQVCNLTKTITVPKDHYFMVGDNRGNSQDSRFWGPVPRDWIIGTAFATYWPLTRLGFH